MKKVLLISLAAASLLASENAVLEDILVESTINDVSSQQVQSADTAEVLAKEVPSVSLVRRSGIANDIIVRGQKGDNINVLVDGGKIYGACPNRMDPPVAHIITPNINTITVIEGPYDVEHAGTLSGLVSVNTIDPQKGFHGNFNLGVGSYSALNIGATLTGGNDTVQALVSFSGAFSNQYKDGNGDDFAQQIINNVPDNAKKGNEYMPKYADNPAYQKKSILTKLNVNVTDHQQLRLSYTGNRSDGILYPTSMMDAQYDNSDLYNVEYTLTDLAAWSKKLDFKYYYSYVDHSMSNEWRRAASPMMGMGTMTNALTDTIQGGTIKNATALTDDTTLTLGLDGYNRNWNGNYEQNGTIYLGPSINDADTQNAAVFAEFQQRFAQADYKIGVRYDNTRIKSGNAALQTNYYQSFGANIFTNYSVSKTLGFFGGIGTASRVPDGKELYFQNKMGMYVGTPDLDQTSNVEVDLGMKNTYNAFNLKTRVFYNKLHNYIYYDSSKTMNNYVNIDAKIYGIEFSGSWYLNDFVYFDFNAAAQRGLKDAPLAGQSNVNLADIPPLKGSLALNWNYSANNIASATVMGTNRWSNYDSDNGEQAIPGWSVMNMEVNHHFDRNFGMILGLNNLFNTTYAISNTYDGLTLLSGANGTMLMNEPGRNFYANFTFQF
jgi:iron complex outermembrane recepter protein